MRQAICGTGHDKWAQSNCGVDRLTTTEAPRGL
jgi:hypothetical protein